MPYSSVFRIWSWQAVCCPQCCRLVCRSQCWQIEEHLQHFCWSCSHCPCDHNACSPLHAFQLGPCQGNAHAISPCDSRIRDLKDYHTLIQPQCHLGRKSPGPANVCIAQPQSPQPLLHLCPHVCFPRQFIIKDDSYILTKFNLIFLMCHQIVPQNFIIIVFFPKYFSKFSKILLKIVF